MGTERSNSSPRRYDLRPPGANKQMRVHGAWVGDDEVRAICDFLRRQGTAVYEEVVLATEEEFPRASPPSATTSTGTRCTW